MSFETKIVVTDVSEREELLVQIETLNPDLLVMGRRGLGTLAKYVAPSLPSSSCAKMRGRQESNSGLKGLNPKM